MDGSFTNSLKFVLRWEGGLSDNPDDHGGRTMKGVTQSEYDVWRGSQDLPPQDVALISQEELATIYRNDYWQPAFCGQLQENIDLVQFDTCVNMGVNRSIKMLQEAVGTTADGMFGALTQAACAKCSPQEVVTLYCSIREALYRKFAEAPGQSVFLSGWLNRLNDLRIAAGVVGQRGPRGPADFGDAGAIERIPDLQLGQPLELWR